MVLDINLLRAPRRVLIEAYTNEEVIQVQKEGALPLIQVRLSIFCSKPLTFLGVLLRGSLVEVQYAQCNLFVVLSLIKIFCYSV